MYVYCTSKVGKSEFDFVDHCLLGTRTDTCKSRSKTVGFDKLLNVGSFLNVGSEGEIIRNQKCLCKFYIRIKSKSEDVVLNLNHHKNYLIL